MDPCPAVGQHNSLQHARIVESPKRSAWCSWSHPTLRGDTIHGQDSSQWDATPSGIAQCLHKMGQTIARRDPRGALQTSSLAPRTSIKQAPPSTMWCHSLTVQIQSTLLATMATMAAIVATHSHTMPY